MSDEEKKKEEEKRNLEEKESKRMEMMEKMKEDRIRMTKEKLKGLSIQRSEEGIKKDDWWDKMRAKYNLPEMMDLTVDHRTGNVYEMGDKRNIFVTVTKEELEEVRAITVDTTFDRMELELRNELTMVQMNSGFIGMTDESGRPSPLYDGSGVTPDTDATDISVMGGDV